METSYVRKTMFLNRNFIKKAVRILNAKSEKDAVNRALELVVEEGEIISAHEAIGGKGEIDTVYK